MSDRLLEAVSALRESATGEEQAIGRYTRSRVLSAVRLQKRRRVLNVAFGIPLAAIVVGSGAWAAGGQTLPLFIQRVSVAFGLRERSPALVPTTLPRASGRTSSASTVTPSDEPLLPAQLPEQVDTTEAPQPSSNLAPESKPAATTPRDSSLTEQELLLYENAHRAHFVDKNAEAALAAWGEYLRQMPRGRFGVEAHYNRALCLVRLGRGVEAQKELLPFVRGAFGNYRKAEAAALLEQLSAASP